MSEMSKFVRCKVCGQEISKKAPYCPQCGAVNKKPIYKRVWFILLVVVLVANVLGSLKKTRVPSSSKDVVVEQKKVVETPVLEKVVKEETVVEEPVVEEVVEEKEETTVENVRADVVEAMVAYETFMDEYIRFMESYDVANTAMLMEYLEYLERYDQALAKLDEIEDITTQENLYMLEIMNRCNQKLLEATSKQ